MASPRTPEAAPTWLRWTIMPAVGMMLFGCYFAYDSISAVSQLLVDEAGYSATEVALMDSVFSWPNVLGAALLAGVLVDRIGARAMSLVFAVVVVLGALLVAVAPSFALLLLGRALVGIGAEALAVCQGAILVRWFKAKELALSFALALVFARLGSFAAQNVEVAIARRFGAVAAPLWFAVIVCGVSLVFVGYYAAVDRLAEDRFELGAAPRRERIALADLAGFDRRFWLLLGLATVFYGGVVPFRGLAQDFFHDNWGIEPEVGARLVSILSASSMVLAPAIGLAVDRFGKRTGLLVAGAALMVPAHLSLAVLELDPLYPMLGLGVAFALVSAVIWPSVALVVDEGRLGTAYGLIFVVQNIALAVLPLANGWLRDATGSYFASELMFTGLGLISLVLGLGLVWADRGRGGVLAGDDLGSAKHAG